METGNGASEDGSISYGFASTQGRKNRMEDYLSTGFKNLVPGTTVGLFGVFDGHGGSSAAEYLEKRLFNNLVTRPEFLQDPKRVIMESYKQTDADFLGMETSNGGSTASTAILIGHRLLVANVGDSRTVMSRSGKAVPLSIDHKPDRPDELQRIEQAGGSVKKNPRSRTWRVDGILAVSRAFGDINFKQYVIADPEIQEQEITEDVEFLVLATDGLWDFMSNEEVVYMVQSVQDPERAASALVDSAEERGSKDNITCIVVRFHHGQCSN